MVHNFDQFLGFLSILSILGLVIFIIIKLKNLKKIRGHLLSNTAKIMLFIPDTKYYGPIKLCKMAGSIHLFKITGMLTPKNINLKCNNIWDIIEIDWNGSQSDFNWK